MNSSYNSDKIIKSKGSNESEEYLANLAEKTFLSLWSFPNVFVDRGRKTITSDGKELCDLLVVFQNHILIFSDKACNFKEDGDIKTNWKRWLKRAVLDSADQIYGAERIIKAYPEKLFLDKKCTIKLPVEIPNSVQANYHRIIIAKNSTKEFRKFVGGSGSLILAPDMTLAEMGENPFHIGNISEGRGFIHVLDDVNLDILMKELDTVSDFVNYLTKKENYIVSGKLGIAAGEEELLGAYLLNSCKFPDYPDTDKMLIDEGHYADLVSLPQYSRGRTKDRSSYIIDSFIENFAKHVFNRTSETENVNSYEDEVIGLKRLAAEDRLSRRVLGDAFLQKIMSSFQLKNPSSRIVKSPNITGLTYVFLIVPVPDIAESYLDYRIARKNLLIMYCQAVKFKIKSSDEIVGIAVDTPDNEKGTEDIVHMDCRNWGVQEYAEAESTLADLNRSGLMKDFAKIHGRESKYPIMPEKSKLGKLKKRKIK